MHKDPDGSISVFRILSLKSRHAKECLWLNMLLQLLKSQGDALPFP